jgi:F0F1-type ATP synthase delta subunit
MLDTLKKVTNSKSIILNVFYDPRLLAGLVIEYKSKLIDFSILKEFSLLFNEI